MGFISRLFRLQPGEDRLLLVLGSFLMLNSLARQVAGIVAVSGFLSEGGVNQMLLIIGIDYALVMAVGALQSLVVDKFNRIKLMSTMTLIFAAIFVLLRIMFYFKAPGWLNYSVMYLVVEQQFIFFPMIFWVMANDVSSMAQSKRLFPLISSWNFVGILLGTAVAALSPGLFARLSLPIEDILYLNVVIYLLAYLLLTNGLRSVAVRKVAQPRETIAETLREGWDFVRGVTSFRYLTLAILALALVDTIVEFRFYVVTDAAFSGQETYQRFFSLYTLAVTIISFAIQALVTGRLLQKMNLKDTFFFFPGVAFLGVVGMLLVPGASMAVAAMLLVKLLRDTIFDSTLKAFQALVPEERRGRVSTFLTSYLPAIGTILACLITGAIVALGVRFGWQYHFAYLAVALGGAALAVFFVVKMRETYESSLLNWRLKRRQRSTSSVLDKLDF